MDVTEGLWILLGRESPSPVWLAKDALAALRWPCRPAEIAAGRCTPGGSAREAPGFNASLLGRGEIQHDGLFKRHTHVAILGKGPGLMIGDITGGIDFKPAFIARQRDGL